MRKRKIIGIVIAVLAIAAAVVGIYIFEKKAKEDDQMKALYDDAKGKTIQLVDYKGHKEKFIDWEKYKGTDVVGWLFFGEIEYPIVQGNDNDHYLTHTYDGEYNYNGSVFLSCHCKSDFSGTNSIVYGHNMDSGLVFGKFDDYISSEKYSGKREFYIYLPDGTKHTYELFAISHVNEGGIAYYYEFATKKDYEKYQKELLDSSVFKFRESVNLDRNVCTLSTCNNWGSSYGKRIVYVGMETKVEQIQEKTDWNYKVK